MHFDRGLIDIITYQQVCHLHGIFIHSTRWIDALVLITIAAEVLDGIEYAGFNDF